MCSWFSPHHVSYLVLFQSVDESLKGGCVEQGRVDEQRLHGIACSRVVTLGIHNCTYKKQPSTTVHYDMEFKATILHCVPTHN